MNYQEWAESLLKTRQEREKKLIQDSRNWFSLAGLFWLEEGNNSFGGADGNKIVLSGLPEIAGMLHLQEAKVTLTQAAPGLLLNSKPAEYREIKSDSDGEPDLLEFGAISLMVIRRGERHLLRVWDGEAQAVKDFHGLNFFPPNPDFCLTGKFTPYDPPRSFTVTDVIGTRRESRMLGRLTFTLEGRPCELEVEDADDEGLVSFTDETRKDASYPGGRWLALPKPLAGEMLLDFNRASNWPCAYTPWATCPLPPESNHLPVRIEAGEMRYHD